MCRMGVLKRYVYYLDNLMTSVDVTYKNSVSVDLSFITFYTLFTCPIYFTLHLKKIDDRP